MTDFAHRLAAGLAALALIALAPAGLEAQSGSQGSVVNFNQAEIQAVIDDVSAVTGNTFIVDPNVRGRVTITSQAPLTPDQYFQVFLSTMRVHGYAVVPTASGAYQIIPEQAGARTSNPVNADLRGDQYVTSVVRLNHAGTRDALTVVRPMSVPTTSSTPPRAAMRWSSSTMPRMSRASARSCAIWIATPPWSRWWSWRMSRPAR